METPAITILVIYRQNGPTPKSDFKRVLLRVTQPAFTAGTSETPQLVAGCGSNKKHHGTLVNGTTNETCEKSPRRCILKPYLG